MIPLVAGAQADIRKALEALRAAARCRTERGSWSLISTALGHVANADAKLADVGDEMAVTTGEAE